MSARRRGRPPSATGRPRRARRSVVLRRTPFPHRRGSPRSRPRGTAPARSALPAGRPPLSMPSASGLRSVESVNGSDRASRRPDDDRRQAAKPTSRAAWASASDADRRLDVVAQLLPAAHRASRPNVRSRQLPERRSARAGSGAERSGAGEIPHLGVLLGGPLLRLDEQQHIGSKQEVTQHLQPPDRSAHDDGEREREEDGGAEREQHVAPALTRRQCGSCERARTAVDCEIPAARDARGDGPVARRAGGVPVPARR